MNPSYKKRLSKFLSLLLRHQPDKIGLKLDEYGWANVNELLSKINSSENRLSFEDLKEIVDSDEKNRYSFTVDFKKIRANQGHSISVNLELNETSPPEVLYHGTIQKYILSIKESGLQKQNRNYVHLSADKETAIKVGKRRGHPIVLQIKAKYMFNEGYQFYLSNNGVWLINHVPVKYIDF